MTVNRAIKKRRSIRKYKSKKVSDKLIKKILKAATLAPSAKNRQPWKFIVCTQQSRLELIAAMEEGINRESNGNMRIPEFDYGLPDAKNTLRIMKQSPVLIVILNTNGKSPFNTVNDSARIVEICDTLSIGAAVQNMILTAQNYRLATLWIANTCFAYQELEKLLNTDSQITGLLALGYGLEKPKQRKRKDFDEVVEFKK